MHKHILKIIMCAFIASLTMIATTARSQVNLDREDFKRFIAKEMKTWNVPGAAVLIIKDGQVIFSEGFGYRDLSKKLKVTPATIFPIASCTKTFTSSAVGLLVDEGKVDWDAPVRNYYPGLMLYDKYSTEHITPRDILCHRSGIPRHDRVWLYTDLPREELMARLRYLRPNYGFREVFQYNNIIYTVAGVMLEKLTGLTYEEFIKRRIFQPLGMTNSNLSLEETLASPNYALPYYLTLPDPTQIVDDPARYPVAPIPFQTYYTTAPASSINSCLNDMGKWIMFHLNEGQWKGDHLISEETMRQIHSPQMATSSVGEFKAFISNETPMINYGLGWVIQPYRGHYMLNHSGGVDGFSSFIGFMPGDRIGVVVLTNMHRTMFTYVVAYNVFDRMLQLSQDDRSTKYLNTVADIIKEISAAEVREKGLKKQTQPTHSVDSYVGTYSEPAYGKVDIGRDGDDLYIFFRKKKIKLIHNQYNTFDALFVAPGGNMNLKVTFLIDSKGEISSLSMPLQPGVDDILFNKISSEAG